MLLGANKHKRSRGQHVRFVIFSLTAMFLLVSHSTVATVAGTPHKCGFCGWDRRSNWVLFRQDEKAAMVRDPCGIFIFFLTKVCLIRVIKMSRSCVNL